jgi:alkylated DNA repair dioxygenase AlkB
LDGVRAFNEDLYAARPIIETKVNEVLDIMVKQKYEYPGRFSANVAFCNLYANGGESVGYHADQLTYLGPHPTIASLSLGCEREVLIFMCYFLI